MRSYFGTFYFRPLHKEIWVPNGERYRTMQLWLTRGLRLPVLFLKTWLTKNCRTKKKITTEVDLRKPLPSPLSFR